MTDQTTDQSPLSDFVRFLVEPLVDNPDAVEVKEQKKDGSVSYRIRVDTSDAGRVIGRQGRTVRALRTITAMANSRIGDPNDIVDLDIVD